ncbi:MAG: hypothetical protein ABWX83_08350 [Luteibacter sp.]
MGTPLTSPLRRFASTIFVFLALFVACVGVQAMPCNSHGHADGVAEHVALLVDDTAEADDQDALPSIEDNNGGLDDTFDVPPEHAVTVPHVAASRPPGLAPAPHAHHPSLDLRPPIA